MHGSFDQFLVWLALSVSCAYAVSALGPRTWRCGLLRGGAHLAEFCGLRRLASRLADAAAAKGQRACGGCDGCRRG
ncbi:MAG TPA: hypothetical protein VMV25_03800 [Steroidobacteraceae bacterium]|nr:hypothetical protein [Steroidobacteraceae bacterium]